MPHAGAPRRRREDIGGRDARRHRLASRQREHREAGDDPADGPENPDEREVTGRVLDVMERHRVAERERRHVAEGVGTTSETAQVVGVDPVAASE